MDQLLVFYQNKYAKINVDEYNNIANYYIDKDSMPFHKLKDYLQQY